MALPAAARSYIIGALELPGELYIELLSKYGSTDPIWDIRPYPDRFSMKEALAHVADWNDIYLERIERTRDEDFPSLPNVDEGELAIENDYANSDGVATLARFAVGRRKLIDVVKSLSDGDWERKALRTGVGELSISEHITLINAHDAYHMRQVIDYLNRG